MIEKQKLSADGCAEILKKCATGILSLKGLDEFPYSVPVNYAFVNNKIYIHGNTTGTKIQNIQKDAHVTFCVIEKDQVVSEMFTTNYSSVIVYGTAKMLETREDKYNAMTALMEKYSPGLQVGCMQKLERENNPGLGIIEITPVKMIGKQSETH